MTNQWQRRIRLLEHRYSEPHREFQWEDLPEIWRFLVGFEKLWPEDKGIPGFALDQHQRVLEAFERFRPKMEKIAEENKRREKEESKRAAEENKRREQQKRQLEKEEKRREQERKKQAEEEARKRAEEERMRAEEEKTRREEHEQHEREEQERKRRERIEENR